MRAGWVLRGLEGRRRRTQEAPSGAEPWEERAWFLTFPILLRVPEPLFPRRRPKVK